MGVVERNIKTVPVGEIKGIDTLFGRQMKFDANDVPKRYKAVFDKTRKDSFEALTVKGIFESREIEDVRDGSIRLRSGEVLESAMLAKAFHLSSELVFYVVSVAGYEALDETEENMAAKLFLDSWGTAVVESGSTHFKRGIAKELEKENIYATFAFSPGQHNISMELQKVIFGLLAPEEIGVTLNEHFLMHPKKSVSGIFGIGPNRDAKRLRPCDFCNLRTTCSSAYTDDMIERD
jgi:hypothetical protein